MLFSSVLTPVANIDLPGIYDDLGMLPKYEEAKRKFDLTEDINIWKVVMIKGVPYEEVLPNLYDKIGIQLDFRSMDPKNVFNPKKDQRNPSRDGSYLVSFDRYVDAGTRNSYQSASRRKGQGFKDITLPEYLILDASYFLKTRSHLGVGIWTHCSGSRDLFRKVPGVQYFPKSNKIIVDTFSPGDSLEKLCTRDVVSTVFLNA